MFWKIEVVIDFVSEKFLLFIIELWNCRLERSSGGHLVQPPAQSRTVTNTRSGQPWLWLNFKNLQGWRLYTVLWRILIKCINASSCISEAGAQVLSVKSPLQLKPSSWLVSYSCSCHCCHLLLCTIWFIYGLQYLFSLIICFRIATSFGMLYIPNGSGFVCEFFSV